MSALADARSMTQPPLLPFPIDAAGAFELAAWYVRYGLDRLDDGPRRLSRGIRGHATIAQLHHTAIATLLEPANDEVS